MTAIAPNTTIWLLNTRLNYNSEDTFYFESLSQQTSYFDSLKILSFTNYTYQREQRQYIKVGVNGSDMAIAIKTCNYLMWKNSSYENKNYYAFITEVEWINNEVVKMYFEMDYIQTYMFNFNIRQCFIIRQHSETDRIGENILPEPVELGEYVINGGNTKCIPEGESSNDQACIVVVEVDSSQSTGRLTDGVYSAVKLHVYDISGTGVQLAQNLINSQTVAGHPENILAIYATKYYLLGLSPDVSTDRVLSSSQQPFKRSINVPDITENDEIDGYTPKNKKLFTYPYTFCNVTNCKGGDINLRYEWWNRIEGESYCQLKMYNTRSMPVTIQIRPYSYKGETYSESDSNGVSTDIFVELSGQPLGSFAVDNFTAWLAQNQANLIGTAFSIASTGVVGGVMAEANPMAAVTATSSIVDSIVNTGVQAYNASIAADRFSGTISGSAVQYNNELDGLYYRRMSVNRQYARSIDDFFTMYGYTQNKLATPNIHARTRYTYVRTLGFNCVANIPQDARAFINKRFDNGIRFWVDKENTFCDYSTPNLPLT